MEVKLIIYFWQYVMGSRLRYYFLEFFYGVAYLVWPLDTNGFGPTNPRVKSVNLYIRLVRFIISQNHMAVGELAYPIYM